jgi:hypothetical protein
VFLDRLGTDAEAAGDLQMGQLIDPVQEENLAPAVGHAFDDGEGPMQALAGDQLPFRPDPLTGDIRGFGGMEQPCGSGPAAQVIDRKVPQDATQQMKRLLNRGPTFRLDGAKGGVLKEVFRIIRIDA